MANILTLSRIGLALILLSPPAFSAFFMVLYVLAGLTDMLDGFIARKAGTVSETGARLDTIADLVFTSACLAKLLPVMELPTYLWLWTA